MSVQIRWINPPPGSGRARGHVEDAAPYKTYINEWKNKGWIEIVKAEKPAPDEAKPAVPEARTRAYRRAPKKS